MLTLITPQSTNLHPLLSSLPLPYTPPTSPDSALPLRVRADSLPIFLAGDEAVVGGRADMLLDNVTHREFLVAAREELLAVWAVVFGGCDAAHWRFGVCISECYAIARRRVGLDV